MRGFLWPRQRTSPLDPKPTMASVGFVAFNCQFPTPRSGSPTTNTRRKCKKSFGR